MKRLAFAGLTALALMQTASAVFVNVASREFVKIRRSGFAHQETLDVYQLQFRVDCTPLSILRSDTGEVRVLVGESDAVVFGIQLNPAPLAGLNVGSFSRRVHTVVSNQSNEFCALVHRTLNTRGSAAGRLLVPQNDPVITDLSGFFSDELMPQMRVVGVVPAPRTGRHVPIVSLFVSAPPRIPRVEFRRCQGDACRLGVVIELRGRLSEQGPLINRCDQFPLRFLGGPTFPEILTTSPSGQETTRPWVQHPDVLCREILNQY